MTKRELKAMGYVTKAQRRKYRSEQYKNRHKKQSADNSKWLILRLYFSRKSEGDIVTFLEQMEPKERRKFIHDAIREYVDFKIT